MLPARALAAERVDPRFPFTAELAAGGGLTIVSTAEADRFVLVRAQFLGPVAANVQAGGGFWADTAGFRRFVGGLRWSNVSEAERFSTSLDVQAVADVMPDVAIGVRGAFGAAYEVVPGWRVGAQLGGAVTAIFFRAVFDAAATVSYSW